MNETGSVRHCSLTFLKEIRLSSCVPSLWLYQWVICFWCFEIWTVRTVSYDPGNESGKLSGKVSEISTESGNESGNGDDGGYGSGSGICRVFFCVCLCLCLWSGNDVSEGSDFWSESVSNGDGWTCIYPGLLGLLYKLYIYIYISVYLEHIWSKVWRTATTGGRTYVARL